MRIVKNATITILNLFVKAEQKRTIGSKTAVTHIYIFHLHDVKRDT